MTLQSFEPGQIVYEEQSHKTETELGNGQGSVLPDTQRQAPDRSIFRMKIQKDSDGAQCAFDRFRVYRIFDGVAKYVNHWD